MDTSGDIFICGHSALEYWRFVPSLPARGGAIAPSACRAGGGASHPWAEGDGGVLDFAPNVDAACTLASSVLGALASPLEVMVGRERHRRHTPLMSCRLYSRPLPARAFVRAARNVLVASPELCFVDMSCHLSFEQLVCLGFELCGTYMPPLPGSEELRRRPGPLTSKADIAAFLGLVCGMRGCEKARRALDYVLEDSASPTETVSAMLLSLPYRLGGFGLPAPQLNVRIDLDDKARPISGHGFHRVDLYWRKARFGIEYDSRSVHARKQAFEADRLRENALKAMGIDEISLTPECLRNDSLLEAQARYVARRIGFRLRNRLSDGFERRMGLRRGLLGAQEGSAKPIWPGMRPQAMSLFEALRTHRA